MFSSIKKIFSKPTPSQQEKTEIVSSNMRGQTIGGATKTKPMQTTPNKSSTFVEKKTNIINTKESSVELISDPKIEEIATIFSEGDKFLTLETIKNYFKEKQGDVDKRIWYMLMDLHHIFENKEEFDKTAIAFAQYFGRSPPTWFESENKSLSDLGIDKNMVIFPKIFNSDYTEEFKSFFRAARKNHFCRINISQCKFEQNDVLVLKSFIDLLQNLRKANIPTVLMGDNGIIRFIHDFIKDPDIIMDLHSSYLSNHETVWLANLEFLQWKNNFKEFEIFSIKYADKFEISPPDWEKIENISIENDKATESEESFIIEEAELTTNNIQTILKYVDENISMKNSLVLDFSKVERIDFGTAGILSYHTQELINSSKGKKSLSIKNPNEMILVLLQILGINEIISIEARKRT